MKKNIWMTVLLMLMVLAVTPGLGLYLTRRILEAHQVLFSISNSGNGVVFAMEWL